MLEADDISSKVKLKPGDANFVTAYDVAVEKYLTEELTKQLPDASVIGEEEAAENTSALKGGLYFIIDPIDGTTNFIYGRRYSAISVGLCDRGDMVYGAIFNPYADRLYFVPAISIYEILVCTVRAYPSLHCSEYRISAVNYTAKIG